MVRFEAATDPRNGGDISSKTNLKEAREYSWARRFASALLAVLLVLTSVWSIAALYIDIRNPVFRVLLPCTYLILTAGLWSKVKRRLLASALILGCFAIVLGWWSLIPPSNARAWQPDVAVLPYAEVKGDRVTVHNIRYCKYRTETDFDVHHYDKTFDLATISSVDLFLVYWGSKLIAHTMLSFGFGQNDYICMSIEARKEQGESYSAIRGFFRQFELTYVIADERDVVRLRTNFRNEAVYLYRLHLSPEAARALFLQYLQAATELYEKPRWYNALTDNCTTNIRIHADRARGRRTSLDWRIIVNGYADQMLYERGRIDTSLSFAALKERSLINTRARDSSEESFSRKIREVLPGIH